MWYFELQPDYAESKYTPEFARTFVLLSVHVKTAVYKCIRVWSCKLLRYANKWSYRYGILPLDR